MLLQGYNYGFGDAVGAPLGKGAAIAREARLAENDDKLTELAIIALKEHWIRVCLKNLNDQQK